MLVFRIKKKRLVNSDYETSVQTVKYRRHDMDHSRDVRSLLKQLAIARNEIKNLRQQIVSLKHNHRKDVEEIKNVLEHWTCLNCKNEASTSNSNVSVTTKSPHDFPFKVIGYIETAFANKRGVPRQPGILSESHGVIRLESNILTNPHHAIEGLENFSHMWILFHFHSNENTHIRAKVAPPRLNGIRTGVFATRSPHRPSPIGLSLVKIDKIESECIHFSGIDMVNGTPVLDIKPYVPQYDTPCVESTSTQHSNQLCDDNSVVVARNLHWERLPRESDGRSEDGDSILQDQSDLDFDIQERLLIGEASQSSEAQQSNNINEATVDIPPIRVLDGRDSDDVFLSDAPPLPLYSSIQGNFFDRSPLRLASQREAPEGSEGSSPPSPAQTSGIRVANWISNAPVSRLSVQFSDECSRQIESYLGSTTSAARVKSTIISVLSEDPRSVYVRNRYSDEPYVCSIERLIITCFFDDTAHACLVTNIEECNSSNVENEN